MESNYVAHDTHILRLIDPTAGQKQRAARVDLRLHLELDPFVGMLHVDWDWPLPSKISHLNTRSSLVAWRCVFLRNVTYATPALSFTDIKGGVTFTVNHYPHLTQHSDFQLLTFFVKCSANLVPPPDILLPFQRPGPSQAKAPRMSSGMQCPVPSDLPPSSVSAKAKPCTPTSSFLS